MSHNQNLSSTGFKNLDNLIGGFASGELVLIGGRPSMGVTQLLINLAINFSEEAPVFYFTPSRSQSSIINRITSSLTKIPMERFAQKSLTINDTITIAALGSNSAFNRIHIHDSCVNSMEVLNDLREKVIEQHKLKFIVIDNLQELCHSQIVSKFIKELKGLASDFGITVIMATEINKAVDTRNGDRRPELRDLPKNKIIGELSDKIIFVYRPEVYRRAIAEEGDSTAGLVELIVAKNINGKAGRAQLKRDSSLTNVIDF